MQFQKYCRKIIVSQWRYVISGLSIVLRKMMELLPDNKSATKYRQEGFIQIVRLPLIRLEQVVNGFKNLLDSECFRDDNQTQDTRDFDFM